MSIVQVTCLGKLGRFGNNLFQYAVARAYAESIGAELQTPKWFGQEIFEGMDNPTPSKRLPKFTESYVPTDGRGDVDLYGYFQNQDCVKLLSRAKIREWFKLKPDVEQQHRPQIKCGPYCAWHLRLEDYVSNAHFHSVYASVTHASYCRAMLEHKVELPIVTVSADFSRGWLTDFLTLRDSAVLFRANSTFSWWAGVLGDAKVFSPVVEHLTGWQDVPFVPGNWPRFCDHAGVTDLYLPD